MFEQLTIIGNLGKEPEMRFTPNGQAVTNLSVATNRVWNDAQGVQHKETSWFRVTVWGKPAESCNQYLHKGSKVLVVGRLNIDPATGGPRVWTRQDGTAGASFEVTAENVRFLDGASNRNEGNGPTELPEDDDIPF